MTTPANYSSKLRFTGSCCLVLQWRYRSKVPWLKPLVTQEWVTRTSSAKEACQPKRCLVMNRVMHRITGENNSMVGGWMMWIPYLHVWVCIHTPYMISGAFCRSHTHFLHWYAMTSRLVNSMPCHTDSLAYKDTADDDRTPQVNLWLYIASVCYIGSHPIIKPLNSEVVGNRNYVSKPN